MYYVVLVLGLAGTEQRVRSGGQNERDTWDRGQDRKTGRRGESGMYHCSTLLPSNTCLLSVLIFTVGTFTLAVNWFPAMT